MVNVRKFTGVSFHTLGELVDRAMMTPEAADFSLTNVVLEPAPEYPRGQRQNWDRLASLGRAVRWHTQRVVPPVLFLGFVAGFLPRGWWVIPAAALAWPALLVAAGVDSGAQFVLAASLVGAANAAVGVVPGLGIRTLMRSIRVAN